jgi:hypothetical protein
MPQVFISYSRRDLSFVERLVQDLKRNGMAVWYDLSGLEGGERWGEKIQQAIRQSSFVIVVLSPDSVQSEWVEREFLFASNEKKKIIPLLYRQCEMPFNYLNLNYIDVQGERYNQNFDKIMRGLGMDQPTMVSGIKKSLLPQKKADAVTPQKSTGRTVFIGLGVLLVCGFFACGALVFLYPNISPMLKGILPSEMNVSIGSSSPTFTPTPTLTFTPNAPAGQDGGITVVAPPPSGQDGITVAIPPPSIDLWRDNFSDANGWSSDKAYWGTIMYPDVNGDGIADVCGRGGGGINCALSNGTSFGQVTIWRENYGDAHGWKGDQYYWGTIQYPDVNGDGKADVCGRGGDGINCAISNGNSFGEPTVWRDNFSDANGWNWDPSYWGTIAYPDVNGDGKADVCGRGGGGINCALSNGTSFGQSTVWRDDFSDANGWKGDKAYWGTIQYPDVNGDGMADVCGRGEAGIHCALSTGSSFGTVAVWRDNFSDANGWKGDQAYWGTIEYPDVNGDGKADVCGRGGGGINCAISNGNSFGESTVWRENFGDAQGWKADQSYWGTIQYPDVNGDGKADVCGRGGDGVNCALSTGSTFSVPVIWSNSFSDSNNWKSSPAYWGTILFPDVNGDGKADVCARFTDGINCGLSTGSSFQAPTR